VYVERCSKGTRRNDKFLKLREANHVAILVNASFSKRAPLAANGQKKSRLAAGGL